MPSNIILLAAVVIVIIAIGVVVILLIRRGRRAAEEDLFSGEDAQHEATPPSGGRFEPATIAPDDLDGELLGIGSLLTPAASRPTNAHVVTEPVLSHEPAPAVAPIAAPAAEASADAADESPAEAGHQAPSSAGVLPPVEIPFAVEVAPRLLGAPMSEPAPTWQAPMQPSATADRVTPAYDPRFANAQPPAGDQDYLRSVEQLLAEWRTKHDLALARESAPADAGSEQGRADQSRSDEAAAAGQPTPPTFATHPPREEPARPAGADAAAFVTPPTSSSLPVFEAAEYEAAAADLHTHAVLLDPLGVVMLDMLDGTGKLTEPELKRLEVFRPDHVELAARNIQFPPRLQDDEDAVMRLAQIQLYAASLELRAKWSGQAGGQGDRPLELPYSPRDFKLKIARDIMALPASDRMEVIGYLLGGLLGTPGSSTGLKRAIIDTLEHLRSAQLANVLLDCLDDPDPIIQEYALAAADRLLDT